jgi:hypothetical protein
MYLPILAIILYKFNLSFIEISYVLAVHGLSLMIFKVPLGYIMKTKNISNKSLVFTGEIFKTLGVLGLAFSYGNLYSLVISQIISGTGFALTTSTESNLLFAAMKSENIENHYRKMEAKSQGFSFLSILISGITGSIVAAKNITMPLYLTAPFSLFAAITILFFHEPQNTLTKNYNKNKETKIIKSEFSRILNYLLFYALNRALILTIFVFVLPVFLLKVFNIDLVYFGTILSLFSLTAFLIANNFEKLWLKFDKNELWIITPSSLFLAMFLLILKIKILLLIIPILLSISASIVRPLTMGKVYTIIKENNNTVISIGEQVFGLLNALFLIIMGYSFSYCELNTTLYILMLIFLLGNAMLMISTKLTEKSDMKKQVEAKNLNQ